MYKGTFSKVIRLFCLILTTIFMLILTSNTSMAQVSQTDSCLENAGYWYIVDRYVTNPSTASPYYTKKECHEAALGLYGCIPSIEGQQFKTSLTSSTFTADIDFINDLITDDYRAECIGSGTRDAATCGTDMRYYTCNCKVNNTAWYSGLGLSTTWTSQDGTRYECALEEFKLKDLKVLGTSKIVSPIGLLNMIVNMLAAVAIFLFIINFLQGALLYVRSNGEEAGLKNARHKVTSSITGIIFMFLVTRVIMFVYEILL